MRPTKPEASILLEYFPQGAPSSSNPAKVWCATMHGGSWVVLGHGKTRKQSLRDLDRVLGQRGERGEPVEQQCAPPPPSRRWNLFHDDELEWMREVFVDLFRRDAFRHESNEHRELLLIGEITMELRERKATHFWES